MAQFLQHFIQAKFQKHVTLELSDIQQLVNDIPAGIKISPQRTQLFLMLSWHFLRHLSLISSNSQRTSSEQLSAIQHMYAEEEQQQDNRQHLMNHLLQYCKVNQQEPNIASIKHLQQQFPHATSEQCLSAILQTNFEMDYPDIPSNLRGIELRVQDALTASDTSVTSKAGRARIAAYAKHRNDSGFVHKQLLKAFHQAKSSHDSDVLENLAEVTGLSVVSIQQRFSKWTEIERKAAHKDGWHAVNALSPKPIVSFDDIQ